MSQDGPNVLSLHAPLFDLSLYEEKGQIIAVEWGWSPKSSPSETLNHAKNQLDAYFDGDRIKAFEISIAIPPQEKEFWRSIQDIPYGKTISYKELANKFHLTEETVIDRLYHNPFPILIPCHRVVFDDNLGPYGGEGGPETKKILLVLEGVLPHD